MVSTETLKILKTFQKILVLSVTCNKCDNKYEKIFKKESIEILKILDLIKNL